MKKFFWVLIFILTFFCITMNIEAETYNCVYHNESGLSLPSSGLTKDFLLEFNTASDSKTIRGKWYNGSTGEINALGDLAVSRDYYAGYYVDLFDGKCPSKIYVCKFTAGLQITTQRYVAIINDNFVDEITKNSYFFNVRDSGDNWFEMFKSREECEAVHGSEDCSFDRGSDGLSIELSTQHDEDHCKKFEYSTDSDGENSNYDFSCEFYNNKKSTMKDLKDKYNGCENGVCNKTAIINEYNKELSELKTFCKSYISIMNKGDSCMDICLDLNSSLSNDAILIGDNKKVNNKCSISDDIVSMIYNVLKWAKYIVPVLVIILSILDFIKAIAAQNDDEMKKAQGKFVKRLIVAALLFLLPLIINFALKTFGFYNAGCDITDLF